MARRPHDDGLNNDGAVNDGTVSDGAENDGTASPGREPEGGLFGWVADFDNPVAVKAASGGPKPPRGKALPLAIAGGSALVVVATVVLALIRPFEVEGGAPAATSPRAHDAPSSTPSASAEAPTVSSVIPDDCGGLYGQAMEGEFERADMHLNQVWTGAREAPAGSNDPELLDLLRGEPSLDCFWLDESGGSKKAVLTVVSEPGPEVTAAVAARLAALGFGHQNDRGGVRYYVETREGGESQGESHFVRDGVWLATTWYGFGPWGYTGHMAENVFS